ncbi:flagellar hook capping protein [Brockia lithotrophica]|uniref:Flagellar hook capping protein n=2 Tax=Brockia lithotrophica TaxID=933949 RepID=A0A660KTV0_9BACL|nr:flagellar hook capping protein [Brockia lithotrophica]
MEVSGMSWVQAPSPVPSSGKGETMNVLGKDTFLKLFLTELRYQDPLSPADGKTFLTELALFSVVESVLKLTELVREIRDRLEGGGGSPPSGSTQGPPVPSGPSPEA